MEDERGLFEISGKSQPLPLNSMRDVIREVDRFFEGYITVSELYDSLEREKPYTGRE